MTTVNIDDATANLPGIIFGLTPGEQLVIVSGNQPLATLTRTPSNQWPCQAGSAKDTKHWMAPDFNAPLAEFRELTE